MLCIAGGKAGKHQCIVELTFGKSGLVAELHFVAHLETGGGVGVWRESLVILQHVERLLIEGIETLLGQIAEGKPSAPPAFKHLLIAIFVFFGHRLIRILAPPLYPQASHIEQLLCGLNDTEVTCQEAAESGQLVQFVIVGFHAFAQVDITGI